MALKSGGGFALKSAMLAGLFTALTGGAAQAQNLVTNGGFETGNFAGWTQSGNTSYTGVADPIADFGPHSGSYYGYFGPVGSDGSLAQTLTLNRGTYNFSFWLANSGGTPNDFTAQIGSQTVAPTGVNLPGFGYTQYSQNVHLDGGSTTIEFLFRQDPGYFYLDDVSLVLLGLSLNGLNANQTAIGQSINATLTAGGPPSFNAVSAALMTSNLASAFDQLSPEIFNQQMVSTLYASQQFSNSLLSCRVAGDDSVVFVREGQCVWARGSARTTNLEHTSSNIGGRDQTGSFATGAQFVVGPDWKAGIAIGYDTTRIGTSTGVTSDGDRLNVGAILKYNPGPLLLAAGVTAGWTSFDTSRPISFGGFNGTPRSSNSVDYVSGQLHAAYLVSRGAWYVKPLVDAAITQISLDGLTETNGNGAGLVVHGASDTVLSVSPGLEIGHELRFDDISVWRPFVRGGVTFQDTGRFLLDANFIGAPSAFTISTKVDQALADVTAGVDVINSKGAALRVQYDGKFGQTTELSSVSVKGSVPF